MLKPKQMFTFAHKTSLANLYDIKTPISLQNNEFSFHWARVSSNLTRLSWIDFSGTSMNSIKFS